MLLFSTKFPQRFEDVNLIHLRFDFFFTKEWVLQGFFKYSELNVWGIL